MSFNGFVPNFSKIQKNHNTHNYSELQMVIRALNVIFSGKWGYHRQGSCQAGLGAAVDKVSVSTFLALKCDSISNGLSK